MHTYKWVYNYANPNIYIVPETSATPLLVTPSNGAIVEPQNIRFFWATVPGASSYTLWIGTTPGAKDALYYTTAHSPNPAGITSTTATLQPGTTYYATMWSQSSAGYKHTASTFQTVGVAYLTAPAAGATVSPLNIPFIWTAVPGVINYTLWIGTTPGAKDALYYSTSATSNPTGITGTTATLQPGATYYATVFTSTSAGHNMSTSTFRTAATSYLTAPANGATVAPRNIPFAWTAAPGVINYTLWIGTTPGAKDALVYSTNSKSNPAGITSTTATLKPDITYYATLWTKTSAGYTTTTSTFQTAATSYLTAPASGSTVASRNIQFKWIAVPGVINYTLWVGTKPGAKDALYYSTSSTSNPTGITGTTATLQPSTTYYATLWTKTSAGYTTSASTFLTAARSYLTAPANSSITSPEQAQFARIVEPVAASSALLQGSSAGAGDSYQGSGTTATSVTSTLNSGVTHSARPSTYDNSQWSSSDSVFTTNTGGPQFVTPANGATGVNPFQPFKWNQVPGAESYLLLVSPTNYNTWDNFAADLAPTVSSAYVWNLQPSTLYYATLCAQTVSGWPCSNSTFTTAPAPEPLARGAFYATIRNLTGQVRLMTQPTTQPGNNIPVAGTYLYQSMLDHYRNPANGASCGDFAGALADLLTKAGVLSRVRQSTLDGGDVHVIPEYWDLFNNKWQIADPTFGVMYFDPDTGMGQGVEDLNALLLSGNLSDITPLWVTNKGSSYATTYYMDPITYYNNPYPFGLTEDEQLVYNNVPNSPLPFLTPFNLSAQHPFGAYMFHFAGQSDQVTIDNAGTNVTIAPISSSGWAQTYGLYSGWAIVSPIPSGMKIYTPRWLSFPTATTAVLTSPSVSATVSPLNIPFTWTAVPGVINYTLWIGTTPGAKDALYYTTAHAHNPAGITGTTATLKPGVTYYATLWTLTSAGYTTTTSTFQTAATSYLTAPASGATVSPLNIRFTWVAVPGVINYTLWIGTKPGAQDALYYSTSATSNPTGITGTTATLRPGATYYATMLTLTSAGYNTSTSTFRTAATSYLTVPAAGATVSPLNIPFTWTAAPGVINYTLWIGATPGAKDALYYTTAHALKPAGITGTTATLKPGVTYYATLWTLTSAGYTTTTSTFQTAATSYLTAPASGATVSPLNIRFTWVAVPGVINYTLWIGTKPGAKDALYYSTSTTSNPAGITSTTATLKPDVTYYATLFTLTSAGYTFTTSTFHTAGTAVVTSPANGASNLDPAVPISVSWTRVSNATSYELSLGGSVGAKNYYDSGAIAATSTSISLKPNTTYYARLRTNVSGILTFTDSVFSTGYPLAHLTYPADGATGVSQFLPFTWTLAQGATGYKLNVSPTGYNVHDFFAGLTLIVPPNNSEYVWALEPNTTYYARLCTENAGPTGGGCAGTTFTTGSALPIPSDRNAFYRAVQNLTAQVRLMTIGFSDVPAYGTYLYQMTADHGRDPTQPIACGWFAAALLDEFAMNNILARQRNISLNGPVGHVLTEYWDPFNKKWQIADPTFGLVYFDPKTQLGQGAEDINALLLAGNYSAIKPLFVTGYGSRYMTAYYMDPLTNFNEVMPFGMLDAQTELNYLPNSPLPYLTPLDLSESVGTAGAYVFQFQKPTDTVVVQSHSTQAIVSPRNSQGWSGAEHLDTGWSILSSIPDGVRIFHFKRVMF